MVLQGFLYFLSLLVLLYLAWQDHQPKRFVAIKIAVSLQFVFLILCAKPHSAQQLLVLAGLFCLCGDSALGFYRLDHQKRWFLLGLVSFLFGHIFFVFMLNQWISLSWVMMIFPFLCLILILALFKIPEVEVGSLRLPVLGYTFFVSLLLSVSYFWMQSSNGLLQQLFFLGSGLFFFSDFVLFFLYFKKNPPRLLHPLNLFLYYGGMFFISISFVL